MGDTCRPISIGDRQHGDNQRPTNAQAYRPMHHSREVSPTYMASRARKKVNKKNDERISAMRGTASATTNNNKTNDYKTNDSSTGHDPQKKPIPKGWVLDVGPAEYRRQCE